MPALSEPVTTGELLTERLAQPVLLASIRIA